MKFLYLLFIGFICTSCGQQYTTPLQNDPFFIQRKIPPTSRDSVDTQYVQRKITYVDKNLLSPKPDETYQAFYARIMRTLEGEEWIKSDLINKLEQHEELLKELKQQHLLMQIQNIELRLNISRDTLQNNAPITLTLFKPYPVQVGDTLQSIAYHNYGTHTAWLAIYRFNKIMLPKGPNLLIPGIRLLLPRINNKDFAILHANP